MSKEQELIDELKEHLYLEEKDIDLCLYDEEVQMCINALEKQIFKLVECKGWKGHSGTRYKCPTCKKIIRCGYEYCSNCGQAVKFPKTKLVDGRIVLDWSEADENK